MYITPALAGPQPAAPTFVHAEQLQPGYASGPLMSPDRIAADLRIQSQRRIGAALAWALLSVAVTFAKDTSVAVPAYVVWAVATVGLPIFVIRANRGTDQQLRTATDIGQNGQLTSAYRAGRMSLGHQALCTAAAIVTYGVVAKILITVLQTDVDHQTMFQALTPFSVAIGAAIFAYRFSKAQLAARA